MRAGPNKWRHRSGLPKSQAFTRGKQCSTGRLQTTERAGRRDSSTEAAKDDVVPRWACAKDAPATSVSFHFATYTCWAGAVWAERRSEAKTPRAPRAAHTRRSCLFVSHISIQASSQPCAPCQMTLPLSCAASAGLQIRSPCRPSRQRTLVTSSMPSRSERRGWVGVAQDRGPSRLCIPAWACAAASASGLCRVLAPCKVPGPLTSPSRPPLPPRGPPTPTPTTHTHARARASAARLTKGRCLAGC